MSVVRGRPPGLAGGMNGSSSRYWSSLSAWPDPKSPTSTRSSSVHIEASQPESPPERRHHNRPALVKPTSTPFQNRLLGEHPGLSVELTDVQGAGADGAVLDRQ